MIYQQGRSTSAENENYNALSECLATEIAGDGYAMPAHKQKIYSGFYHKDDSVKFMTLSRWQFDLEPLKLAGSKVKDNYENYVVDESGTKSAKIAGLGENYALAIFLGDGDFFGSKGQNKSQVKVKKEFFEFKKLFGFDFGHAFRGPNPLLSTLQDDFSYIQPANVNKKFKNLSILDDSPIHEKMFGIFYLYLMLLNRLKHNSKFDHVKISRVINEYESKYPHFKAHYREVKENSIEKILINIYNYYKKKPKKIPKIKLNMNDISKN